MAGAIFTFTDATGAATLSAWAPSIGTRLNAYVPATTPIGQRRTLLATGAPRMWRYRTDETATVELRLIPVASLPLVTRLVAHLLNGGTCGLDTGDGTHTYATLALAPESTPELRLTDPKGKRYTLTLRLLNAAETPVPILIAY